MKDKIENLKFESIRTQKKKGGKRPGAGRKKGGHNLATIEREEALRQYRERVAKITDQLLDKQVSLAKGTQMLFKVHTNKKGQRGRPELITDQFTISTFIENEDGGEWKDEDGNDYYFITTAKPESQAIRDILDRTYGKPEQSVTMKGDSENPLEINITSDEKQTINKTLARYMANTGKQGK